MSETVTWKAVHEQNRLCLSLMDNGSKIVTGLLQRMDIDFHELEQKAAALNQIATRHKDLGIEKLPKSPVPVTGDLYQHYYNAFSSLTAMIGELEPILTDLTKIAEVKHG